jgi:hypothetical protein
VAIVCHSFTRGCLPSASTGNRRQRRPAAALISVGSVLSRLDKFTTFQRGGPSHAQSKAQIKDWRVSATITMAKRYGHIGDSSSRRAMSVSIFSIDGIRIESALELVLCGSRSSIRPLMFCSRQGFARKPEGVSSPQLGHLTHDIIRLFRIYTCVF